MRLQEGADDGGWERGHPVLHWRTETSTRGAAAELLDMATPLCSAHHVRPIYHTTGAGLCYSERPLTTRSKNKIAEIHFEPPQKITLEHASQAA